jgi:hypothetical protein
VVFSEDEYEEHSGDELTNPSYPNMPDAVAAPVAAEEAPTTNFNWSQRPFGPRHFSFLSKEMFVDEEDDEYEEEEEDDEDDS